MNSPENVYPEPKQHELPESGKALIRARINEGEVDVHQLAKEFSCSPSQIAGIKAAQTKAAMDVQAPESSNLGRSA